MRTIGEALEAIVEGVLDFILLCVCSFEEYQQVHMNMKLEEINENLKRMNKRD